MIAMEFASETLFDVRGIFEAATLFPIELKWHVPKGFGNVKRAQAPRAGCRESVEITPNQRGCFDEECERWDGLS